MEKSSFSETRLSLSGSKTIYRKRTICKKINWGQNQEKFNKKAASAKARRSKVLTKKLKK